MTEGLQLSCFLQVWTALPLWSSSDESSTCGKGAPLLNIYHLYPEGVMC